MMGSVWRLGLACIAGITIACGQKGPPLPPLHLLPAPPGDASVRRVGSEARLRFTVPSTNVNGPGAVELDHLEIFAATVAPGAAAPPNREFLTSKYRIGTLGVKPPPVEGEAPPAPPANAPPDTRPSPAEKATFVEKLTAEVMTPVFTTPAPKAAVATNDAAAAAAAPATTAPATGAAATPAAPVTAGTATPPPPASAGIAAVPPLPEPPPTYPIRIYAVRGVTRSGRPGQPSPRLQLPLVDPPVPPASVTVAHSETAILLSWKPPLSEKPVAFNIYKTGGTDPLNTSPVTEPTYERGGLEFGTEECFAVRAVQKIGTVEAESELSDPACITPKDTFAPKAPQHLSAVAAPGVISLSWDANTEADLAGYVVLRGEAPGDTLQALTPAPIAATNFEDRTAQPGVRYAYAIVAVDKARPPNRSAASNRVEETAR